MAAQQQPPRQPAAAGAVLELQPEAAAAERLAVEFGAAGPLGLAFRGGRPGEGDSVCVAQLQPGGPAASPRR